MNYSDNALNILAALTYKGIGKAWIVKNLSGCDSVETVVELLNQNSKLIETSLYELKNRKQRIASMLERLAMSMDGLVALGDPEFPVHRGKVKNSEKPVALFYKGDLSLLSSGNKNISVIGVLQPDEYTQEVEKKMVHKLVEKGATIVSGLANGCDAIAHQQTIDSGGKTVAILPSPLHNILPAGNRGLADQILRTGGLLVTEYLNDARSKMVLGGRYQERDRLQALFSDSIILTSSYAKNELGNDSGSRLAMEYARQYEIPRAVVYNAMTDSDNPKYDLNRQLMREHEDILVVSSDEMGEAINRLFCYEPRLETNAVQSGLF